MKKVIAVELALVLLLIGVMTTLLYQREPRTDVTESEVHTMFESIKGDAPVTEAGNLRIRRIFGLNAADYDLIVYYTPVDSMDVCEFLLIRTSKDQLSYVETALEGRLQSQLTAFDNYGFKQIALLEKAVIRQYGDYICLIVSEEPETWLLAVEELLGV